MGVADGGVRVLFIVGSRWWWAFGGRSGQREACATSEWEGGN